MTMDASYDPVPSLYMVDGAVLYGPTPTGKMIDIKSQIIPQCVMPRVVDCWNKLQSFPDLNAVEVVDIQAIREAKWALENVAAYFDGRNIPRAAPSMVAHVKQALSALNGKA